MFGFPNHNTMTNLAVGDYHPQYVLRSLLSSRGQPTWAPRTGPGIKQRCAGQVIVQARTISRGRPAIITWSFSFGDGSSVLIANGKYLLEAQSRHHCSGEMSVRR